MKRGGKEVLSDNWKRAQVVSNRLPGLDAGSLPIGPSGGGGRSEMLRSGRPSDRSSVGPPFGSYTTVDICGNYD